MKTRRADFVKGVTDLKELPRINLPEVAFAGRSNVGKSSLLNSIVNRKNLARTSSAPGKTQEINFFNVEGKWVFADLPGFGYAKISKGKREEWEKLNFGYLENREELRFICCLVDSRHDPQPKDLALMEWLMNNEKRFVVILTKCDKIKDQAIKRRKEQIEGLLELCPTVIEIIPYSAVSGLGWKDLQGVLEKELK